MLKKDIRKIFRERRAALTDLQMEKLNDLILLQFQRIPLNEVQVVHSFLSSEKLREPDTSLILRFLEFRFPHIKVAAPKMDADRLKMQHYHLTDYDQIATNIYGIDEPQYGSLILPDDIDLVLIPMLGYDERGFRVGYGKGYYDRFLAECRPDVIKVGLTFFEPVTRIDDIDSYDVPLDFCCSPYKLYTW